MGPRWRFTADTAGDRPSWQRGRPSALLASRPPSCRGFGCCRDRPSAAADLRCSNTLRARVGARLRKAVAPKSDARWQLLSADLPRLVSRGVLKDSSKGTRFATARRSQDDGEIDAESSIIDLAWALARALPNGLDDVGDEIHRSGRDPDDQYLWAALKYLSAHLPEADPDAAAWTALVRNRRAVVSAARGQSAQITAIARERAAKEAQGQLFESEVERLMPLTPWWQAMELRDEVSGSEREHRRRPNELVQRRLWWAIGTGGVCRPCPTTGRSLIRAHSSRR